MMRTLTWTALVAWLALAACKEEEPGTQVMVVIDAEPSVRSRVFDVDITVRSGDGDVSTWPPRFEMSLTQGSGPVPWPLEVALVPRDGEIERSYLVVATARGESGGVLAEVRAISGYIKGRSLSLPLVFDAPCLERTTLCSAALTCRAGQCVDPYVAPSMLLPFQPGFRPGDAISQAGASGQSGGAGGQGGASGFDSDGSVPGGDGGLVECEEPPCDVGPTVECTDDRCAGCPESFVRVDGDRCAPLMIGLGLSEGELSPALDTEQLRYEIALPLLTESVALAPRAPEGASIEINGEPLREDTFIASVPLGESTFVLTLRAPGHESRTYTLAVSRGGAERSYLKAHNTGAGDNFGHAVAIDGDAIVIGAPLEDSSSRTSDNNAREDSGAAYVMVREGPSYRQAAYLKANAIEVEAHFGTAVAIDGDTIAVGAPDEREGGSVYVFRRDAVGDWPLEQRVRPASASEGRRFGAALALQGDQLGIGAPGDDTFTVDCGAAYVYTRSGSSWSQTSVAGPTSPLPAIWVGSSVALQGDRLFVGATGDSSDVFPRGSAYIFERNGDSYVEIQKLSESEIQPLDWYGDTIAVDGDTLVIGAFGASGTSPANGALYVYREGSDGFALEQRLGAGNPTADAHLGVRAVLLGDLIITGAPDEDSGARGVNGDLSAMGRTDSGAAYVFARSGTRWTQLALIKADAPEPGARYGYSVAAEGRTIVIGAPNESSGATGVDGARPEAAARESGAVYVVR